MAVTYLKLQDKTVLEFDVKERYFKINDNELLPFTMRDYIVDTTGEIKGDILDVLLNNTSALQTFFRYRKLSVNRTNAKHILNQLHILQKDDYDTNYKTMILCKALSTADDYWITNDNNQKWKDVNVRDNPLHETLAQIALFGASLRITGKIRTPELTGQGAYAKAWFRENGKLYLYKAGTQNGNEARIEALVSNILDCFNVPHVHYDLVKKQNKIVTKCEAVNNSDYSIVDAADLDFWCSNKKENFTDLVKKIDSNLFYQTIVVDYLCSNVDRHMGNWGFFMNNQTGQIIGMHPLFDHNNAFDKDCMRNGFGTDCQMLPPNNLKDAAFYAIKRCDFRCIKPVTRDMFFDDEMYKSFMARAEELGLYKKRKISLFQKITNRKPDEYIPVEIKDDNTSEYWQKLNKTLNLQNFVDKNKKATVKNATQKELYQPQKQIKNNKSYERGM